VLARYIASYRISRY